MDLYAQIQQYEKRQATKFPTSGTITRIDGSVIDVSTGTTILRNVRVNGTPTATGQGVVLSWENSTPTAHITGGSSASSDVALVRGPQGPQGDQGPQGPTGAQGPQGEPGDAFPHVHKQSTIIGGHGLAQTVPATTTYYACPFVDGISSILRGWGTARPCRVKNFAYRAAGTQPTGGSLVVSLLKNGSVATGITVTVPAGQGLATYLDTTHFADLIAGDYLTVQIANAANAASCPVGYYSYELEFDTGVPQ